MWASWADGEWLPHLPTWYPAQRIPELGGLYFGTISPIHSVFSVPSASALVQVLTTTHLHYCNHLRNSPLPSVLLLLWPTFHSNAKIPIFLFFCLRIWTWLPFAYWFKLECWHGKHVLSMRPFPSQASPVTCFYAPSTPPLGGGCHRTLRAQLASHSAMLFLPLGAPPLVHLEEWKAFPNIISEALSSQDTINPLLHYTPAVSVYIPSE